MDCVQNLPLNTAILGAWVARMSDKHQSWVSSVISHSLDELRSSLQAGRTVQAQLLLRFIIILGNTQVLGLMSVMALLQEVLALSEGMKPSKGGDFGVFLTLASLPYISSSAYAKVADEVDSIQTKAVAYLQTRDPKWKPLLRWLKSEELPDRLEALPAALRVQSETKWSSQTIFHVPGFESSMEGRDGIPSLTPLGVTADDIRKNKIRFQVPLVSSRVLTGKLQKDGADDHMADHDRWALEDVIICTMETFGRDVEECSKQLLRIPVLHPHFEPIIVETTFSQMLRLPSPPMLPFFYSRLLEALVDKQRSIKQYVEQMFTYLFERTSDLDEDCLEILSDVFAFHLMRNNYETDWSPFTGTEVAVQSQRFIRRVFERLLRLSFHQNLLHRLPDSLHIYVPPEPVPNTALPVQNKPEFTRMQGFVRIKDPNEKRAVHYCRRLMRLQTKKEEKEGTISCDVALPVEPAPDAAMQCEEIEDNGKPEVI